MLRPANPSVTWHARLFELLAGTTLRSDDFPNHLATPSPNRRTLKSVTWLLVALVVFTLVPRLLMAFRVAVICSDGTYYVYLAESLERGDLTQALNMQFNIFPVVLAGLHKLGLHHETAAKVWGVTMATLTVLPLFGWVRRQFDERVATIACLLYAVHPEMIEWSPEVVREPTFWFFFTLSLYLIWRAVEEVRLGWFIAAGLAITISALTRFEGILLLPALALWTIIRAYSLREHRGRLIFGAIASPLVLPTLLVLLNLCWLHSDSSWHLLRLEPWKRVERLVQTVLGRATPEAPVPTIATLQPDDTTAFVTSKKKPKPALGWTFVHIVERGLTPFFGLLLLFGTCYWWQILMRRDQLPSLLLGLAVLAGIGVHLWYTQQASGRYVMSIVLLSSRGAALGLVTLAHQARLACLALGSRWPSLIRSKLVRETTRPAVLVAIAIVVLAGFGWVDALTTRYQSREMSAELGDWIRLRYGERRVLFGVDEQLAIISYYAHAHYWEPPRGVAGQALVDFVKTNGPELVLVGNGATRARDFTQLVRTGDDIGYERIDPRILPDPGDRVVVLSRVPMVR